jgi:hypothetical protein
MEGREGMIERETRKKGGGKEGKNLEN